MYAIVRARSIFRKEVERSKPPMGQMTKITPVVADAGKFLAAPEGDDIWEVVLAAGSLGTQIETAIAAQEPAFLAKYAFQLAQVFQFVLSQASDSLGRGFGEEGISSCC